MRRLVDLISAGDIRWGWIAAVVLGAWTGIWLASCDQDRRPELVTQLRPANVNADR